MNEVKKGNSVYALFNNNSLVYIGISDNAYQRIGRHVADGDKCFNFCSVVFLPKCTREDIETIEYWLIRRYDPMYNKNKKPFIPEDVPFCTKEEYEEDMRREVKKYIKRIKEQKRCRKTS